MKATAVCILGFVLWLGFVPLSCIEPCGGDPYRIESYHFEIGSGYETSNRYWYFEPSDSVHISEFTIRMVADEFITSVQGRGSSWGNVVMACDPIFRVKNPVTALEITAEDTLYFNRQAVPPHTDLMGFLTPGYVSPYVFEDFNESLDFRFSDIPNAGFQTRFHFHVEIDGNSKNSITLDLTSDLVSVYF